MIIQLPVNQSRINSTLFQIQLDSFGRSAMYLHTVHAILCCFTLIAAQRVCPPKPKLRTEILHEWISLDFKFPPPPFLSPEQLIKKNLYLPQNNALYSMDVFKGNIFLNVQRGSWINNFRDASGVPSTLNRVVVVNGRSYLEPYPSMQAQKIGNCNALQNVAALRVDRTNGRLWVVDFGTVQQFPVCPPKLVSIDLRTGQFVGRPINIPAAVFSPVNGDIADISFLQDQGRTRYLLMPDFREYKIIVFDILEKKFWYFQDKSMQADSCGNRISAGNDLLTETPGVRSIVVIPNSKYAYYSLVAGNDVYQIPVDVLKRKVKDPFDNFGKYARFVGEFPAQTHSALMGRNKIYFADFTRCAIRSWDINKDTKGFLYESQVQVKSLDTVAQDCYPLKFVRSITLDDGYLYFMSNNLQDQRLGNLAFTECQDPNFIVGRIFVNDISAFDNVP